MREKTWNELTADSTEHGKDIYALESTVESGSGAGQLPGLSSLCLPHLLPRLGGVAEMSWLLWASCWIHLISCSPTRLKIIIMMVMQTDITLCVLHPYSKFFTRINSFYVHNCPADWYCYHPHFIKEKN